MTVAMSTARQAFDRAVIERCEHASTIPARIDVVQEAVAVLCVTLLFGTAVRPSGQPPISETSDG